jgi:phosphatidylserine decarboxylase
VRQVPDLFARNERVISVFTTESGPLVMVLVGAMLVSSTQTVWAGEVTPSKNKDVNRTDYRGENISLNRGQEMGRFNMGSTVIVLMPRGTVEGRPDLVAGDAVKVGQRLANLLM